MNKVVIFGGLGNQMFQFALASVLNHEGIPTRISVRNFFIYSHHQGFEISKAFYVTLRPIDKLKIYILKVGSPVWEVRIVKKIMNIIVNVYTRLDVKKFVEKDEFYFDSSIFNQTQSLIIGTWQSDIYLNRNERLIRKIFNFKIPQDLENLNLSLEISMVNAVAVHVRRGDYTNQEWKASHMVITSPKYYQDSIQDLRGSLVNPVFYFFSDDMDWVKKNFIGNDFIFISHNINDKSYIDMYLMSLCKNFIIANSTFSWWAAWLSEHSGKIVIMPDPWLKNRETPGIFPLTWFPKSVGEDTISAEL